MGMERSDIRPQIDTHSRAKSSTVCLPVRDPEWKRTLKRHSDPFAYPHICSARQEATVTSLLKLNQKSQQLTPPILIFEMQRVFSTGMRRAYSSSARALAESGVASSKLLTINFCTPHQPVFKKKAVQRVTVPGADGEYGVTFGHRALISQLKAGVVAVTHENVRFENFYFYLLINSTFY